MDEAKKARLGNRFTCFSCGVGFYDLNKPDPICPKCSTDQRDTPVVEVKPKPKRRKARAKKKPGINPALAKEDDVMPAVKEEPVKELDLEAGQIEIEVESD